MNSKSQRNEAGKNKDIPQAAGESVETPIAEEKMNESVFVYAGNSLAKGALQQFSTFKNGLPVAISEHIAKCAAIGQMMVPVSKLAETRRNLEVVGSREHALNAQIQSYVRGEK